MFRNDMGNANEYLSTCMFIRHLIIKLSLNNFI